ncbi:MAG TPA: POTRA domain-containing protein [Caulobacteraceae bacterium]|nr:POTRA domain-containing protein [Caulobacteraceae bacterium]
MVLKEASFVGASALTQAQLEAAWSSLRDKPVSLQDLRAIAARAEAIYAAAGYPFVAILVPPQEVVDGKVSFQVIEGRISDLTILGLDPVARRQVAAAFEPVVGRTPLPLSAVESAYERAQAVPGLAVAGAVRRGSQPGGMDLVIQAKRKTWRAYANVNNFYSEPVGPWGALVGVDYNGASRFGDRTSAQFYSTFDISEQQVLKLSHTRVLSADATSLNVEFLRAWARPRGTVSALDLATDVVFGRAEISQPLIRSQPLALTLTAGVELTDQETQAFSSTTLAHDHIRVAVGRLNGLWRTSWQTTSFSAEFRRGLNIWGASQSGDADLSRFGADPQATVLRGSIQTEARGPFGTAFGLTVLGQRSTSSLVTPEEFSVGNLTLGRGYDPGASFGDSALGASLEWRLKPFAVAKSLQAQPFVFYDRVRVWNEEAAAPNGRTLESAGGGVRLVIAEKARLDLTYAAPQDPPLGFGEKTPGARLLVNLTIGIPEAFQGLGHLFRHGAAK